MIASEARIAANRANAQKSTGPKTEEGKARSRRNALKHGLTGEGVELLPEEFVAVEERYEEYLEELKPSGSVARTLVRRAATLAVRMEACADLSTAMLARKIKQAEADFVPPEGADDAEITRLRNRAAVEAEFEPTKAMLLARRYEAAAERGFFRALKELRQIEHEAQAVDPVVRAEIHQQAMASFLEMDEMDEEFDALYPAQDYPPTPKPARSSISDLLDELNQPVDVPITIGRRC